MTPQQLDKGMQAAGLNSTELAALLGVHERTVSRWLSAEAPISRIAEKAIASVLNGNVPTPATEAQDEPKTTRSGRSAAARKSNTIK